MRYCLTIRNNQDWIVVYDGQTDDTIQLLLMDLGVAFQNYLTEEEYLELQEE